MPVNISPSVVPQFTMGMFVNLRSVGAGNGWILGHDNGGFDRSLIMHDSRYGYGLAAGNGSTYSSTLPQPRNNLNSWHFIAVAYDQATHQATVAWDNQYQTISVNNGDGNVAASIGGLVNFGSHTVDALVDDVFMFNRQLSQAEIEQVRQGLSGAGTETFTGTATWSDGVSTPVTINANTFTTSRTFADDHPVTGTSSDPFTVSVTIRDDDTGAGSATSSTLTVRNVAPAITALNLSAASINEGQSVTASGTFMDPALGVPTETFSGTATWSDGATTPVTISGGTFSTTRNFADDDPTTGTPFDTFTVAITITDDDLGSDTETSAIATVNNVAPTITAVNLGSASINEGQSVTVTGTFTDPAGTTTGTAVFFDNFDGGSSGIPVGTFWPLTP